MLESESDTPEAQLFLRLWELSLRTACRRAKGKGHETGNEASLSPLPLPPSVNSDEPPSLTSASLFVKGSAIRPVFAVWSSGIRGEGSGCIRPRVSIQLGQK